MSNRTIGIGVATVLAVLACLGVFTGVDEKIVDFVTGPDEVVVDNNDTPPSVDEAEMKIEAPAGNVTDPTPPKRVLTLDAENRQLPFRVDGPRGRKDVGLAFFLESPRSALHAWDPTSREEIWVTGLEVQTWCLEGGRHRQELIFNEAKKACVHDNGNLAASTVTTLEVLTDSEGNPADLSDLENALEARRWVKVEGLTNVWTKCDNFGRRKDPKTGYPGACELLPKQPTFTATATAAMPITGIGQMASNP